MAIRESDARAVALSTTVVAQVAPTDLERPTPCAGWSVRDLLLHMAAQHHGFAAAARGGSVGPADWSASAADVADPVGAYPGAAAEVVEAFASADLDTAQLTLPDFGAMTFPAPRAISFHFIDYLVHAWDVGVSVGVPVRPDDDLLQPAVEITRAVPAGDARTRPGAAFAPVLDGVAAEPDAWRRVLRMLGRDPDWQPPA
ncbi:MAG: TIGR03086 family metal-binding protein [Lapillicoccus sp.]